MSGQKPIQVVLMEAVVLSIIGVGSIVGMVTHYLAPEAVTGVWGALLMYAFKNGYQYLDRRGRVIGRGRASPRAPARVRSR